MNSRNLKQTETYYYMYIIKKPSEAIFESGRKRKHKLITWGDSKNINSSKGVRHIFYLCIANVFSLNRHIQI